MLVSQAKCLGAGAAIFLLLTCLSCGHEQQLVGITIEPATETFGASNIPVIDDAGLSVQLRALGTYIHPPVTKDITTQVTWVSNTPDMVTVDTAGKITATGQSCGNTLISATVVTNHSSGNLSSSGALVTGTMTANVVCFSSSNSQPMRGHEQRNARATVARPSGKA